MADLGIGAASLALEGSLQLMKYIEKVKEAKEFTAKFEEYADRLGQLLEYLDDVIQGVDRMSCKGAVELGIAECVKALDVAKEKLSIKITPTQTKFRGQVSDVLRKLAFPFKKDKLVFLKGVLEEVTGHLRLAVDILNIAMLRATRDEVTESMRFAAETREDLTRRLKSLRNMTEELLDDQTGIIVSEIQIFDRSVKAGQAETLSQLKNLTMEVTRLKEQYESHSIQAITRSSIQDDVSDYNRTAHNIRSLQRFTRKKAFVRGQCTCSGRRSATSYSRWPIGMTKVQHSVHDADCDYAKFEDAVTSLEVKFTLCSVSLQRKAHIGLKLSKGASASSILPIIECEYVVPKSSPGFRLLANFKARLEPGIGPDAWEKPANELLRLFQLRKASPHDRLSNGMTLLHYFCKLMDNVFFEDAEKLAPNYHAMARRILDYLPTQLAIQDDDGMSCIDYFIVSNHAETLVDHFLESGHSVSLWRHSDTIHTHWANHGPSLLSSGPDTWNCSEQLKCVLLKDEEILVRLIKQDKTISDHKEHSLSMYAMATRVGWRRGCEILLEHRVPVVSGGEWRKTLLECAFEAKLLYMAQFWLEARIDLDESALKEIGDVEMYLIRSSTRSEEWINLNISMLQHRRRELQQLAAAHRISFRTDRYMDAQMRSVIKRLEQRGIPVKPSLKSNWRTVYHAPSSSWDTGIIESLYNAGFRDINRDDLNYGDEIAISPLLHRLTSYKRSKPLTLGRITECYISHGASLSECWPNTDITSGHCLGFVLGNEAYYISLLYQSPVEAWLSYFTLQHRDSCICTCSTSGCFFVTSFLKGLTTPDLACYYSPEEIERDWRSIHRTRRRRLDVFLSCLRGLSDRQTRWLISEVLRLIVFTELEMRHTCCKLERLMHEGEPDFNADPTRYDADELQLIQEEDAALAELLEELVEKFEVMYDEWCCGQSMTSLLFEAFIEMEVIPTIEEKRRELKADDVNKFGERWKEMGVIMGATDDDEEESIDTDHDSVDDSDVESFHDEELEG